MMVTGLQLAFKDFLPDESAAESHSRDSETIQGLAFEGILRAKEKQLQDAQTVSASSIAAAVAAMQTIPLEQAFIVANMNQTLTETQTVDTQASSDMEVKIPEASTHPPRQVDSTDFRVELSQGTSQTILKAGTPVSEVDTGAKMIAGKVASGPELSSTFAAPRTEEIPVEAIRVVPQGGQSGADTLPALAVLDRGKVNGDSSQPSSSVEVLQSRIYSSSAVATIPHQKPLRVADTNASREGFVVEPKAIQMQAETSAAVATGIGATSEDGTEMTGTQTSANPQPAEVSHLTPRVPAKVSPEQNTEGESRKFAAQPVTRTEVSTFRPAQGESNFAPEGIKANPKVVAKRSQPIEPRVDKPAPVVSFPQASVETPAAPPVSSETSPDSELRAGTGLTLAPPAEPAPQPSRPVLEDHPAVQPARVETNQNKALFAGWQVINIQSATPEPISEFPQHSKESPSIADVPSGSKIGDGTKSVPLQAAVQAEGTGSATIQAPEQILPDQITSTPEKSDNEINQEKARLYVSRSTTADPKFEGESFEVSGAVEIEPAIQETISARSVLQTKSSTTLPVQDLLETAPNQAVVVAEKSDVEVKQIKEQAAPATKVLQPEIASIETEVPVAGKISTDATGIANKTRQETGPVARAKAPIVASAQTAQRMQSMPVEPGRELPAVETEAVEIPGKVNTPVNEISQAAANDTESAAGVQAAEVSLKPNGKSVPSNHDVGKSEYARTTSESKADTTGKSPAPVQTARQAAAQPVISQNETVKVQPRQATVESNLMEPAHEKTPSAEKQQETNPGFETSAAQTPRGRGNFVESVAVTGPGTEAKIRTAEVVQQIAHHIEARIHNRSTEMRLQLNPKELGEIEVQMVSGPQGVSVTFSAEQPATGRLLETQLNQLRQALTEAGVQLAGLNIGQHSQPRQEGGFLKQNTQFTQPARQDASQKEANVQMTRHPVRTGGTGEVDYLI